MKKHVIIDLVSMWLFIIFAIVWAIATELYDILIFCPFLIVWYSVRTWKWILFIFEYLFLKPRSLTTKGYRCTYRVPIYVLQGEWGRQRIRYSKIYFDDDRLGKKAYIFLGEAVYSGGGELEIIYYPKSRIIKQISKKISM